MKVQRFEWDGGNAGRIAGEIRALQPRLSEVSSVVAEIIGEVRTRGEDAVLEFEERFGSAGASEVGMQRIPESQMEKAVSGLDPQLEEALRTAAENIRAVAEAQLSEDREITAPQGHTVALRDVPVGSAGIYAPGGKAAYPSTVLMGCIPAKVAGVERVVLVTPPAEISRDLIELTGEDEPISGLMLGAASIAGADEVYAIGGAQAIAALAIGTDHLDPVDVVAGPGNRYVQEAKRQLAGEVGIDGIAGPSELMVIAGDTANPDWMALDLCSQAEHGPDGLLVAAAVETVILDEIQSAVERIADDRGIADEAAFALVAVPDTAAGVTLSNAIAPEHLEILTEDAEALAKEATTAGCVFLGEWGATAFGDYAAGSNHILPTGGAGRFQGPLGPGVFRRRMSTVTVTQDAARALAPTVATLARAEGLPLHAESVEARGRDEGEK